MRREGWAPSPRPQRVCHMGTMPGLVCSPQAVRRGCAPRRHRPAGPLSQAQKGEPRPRPSLARPAPPCPAPPHPAPLRTSSPAFSSARNAAASASVAPTVTSASRCQSTSTPVCRALCAATACRSSGTPIMGGSAAQGQQAVCAIACSARCGSSKHALGVQARVAGAKRRTKAWPSACSATRQGWPPRRMHAARSAERAPTLVAVFIHGGCGSLLHALWPFQLLPDSPGGRDQGDKELQKQTDQMPSSK